LSKHFYYRVRPSKPQKQPKQSIGRDSARFSNILQYFALFCIFSTNAPARRTRFLRQANIFSNLQPANVEGLMDRAIGALERQSRRRIPWRTPPIHGIAQLKLSIFIFRNLFSAIWHEKNRPLWQAVAATTSCTAVTAKLSRRQAKKASYPNRNRSVPDSRTTSFGIY
jgi:hypothetical protein